MSVPPSRKADSRPSATVTLDFERPLGDVRALLFDVDLAVRDKIHRGTRLQRMREPDGGQRMLQTQRILDRVQAEEITIEEGLHGSWIKRFVVGPNTGTRFVGSFEELGQSLTRVRLEAFVGPNGFAQGLGKLSPIGLEKAMKRLLGEYKQAIEGYEAGRARGAVQGVLEGWGDVTSKLRALEAPRRRAVISTLIETAWSIAALDEEVDDAERDALHAVVAALWLTPIDPETEEKMVRAAREALATEGVAARCQILGKRLGVLGFAEIGLRLAVLVAEVSRGIDAAELEALQELATAAGVDGVQLAGIIRTTEDAISGREPPSRISTFV